MVCNKLSRECDGSVMANTGALSPGTVTDSASSWTNPNNIKVSDGAYATASTSMGNQTSSLTSTNFGFSIPTDATIDSIKVEVEDYMVLNGGTDGNQGNGGVYIVGGSGTSSGYIYYTSTTKQYQVVGNDLWGLSWTPAQINASGFGMRVYRGAHSGTATSINWFIDHVRITVYYTYTPPPTIQGVSSIQGLQSITL